MIKAQFQSTNCFVLCYSPKGNKNPIWIFNENTLIHTPLFIGSSSVRRFVLTTLARLRTGTLPMMEKILLFMVHGALFPLAQSVPLGFLTLILTLTPTPNSNPTNSIANSTQLNSHTASV
nr:expressed protein [Hymenolepis microstoma]